MTTPTIADLPVANVANNSDQLLLRQPAGALGTDKSVTVQKLRQIDLTALSSTPVTAQVSDLMMISQGGTNYQIRFDNVGFIAGTQMWFYQNTAPSGWSIIAQQDMLLGVKGGTTYTTGGSVQGDWVQEGHTLTVDEMPSHNHESGNWNKLATSGNKGGNAASISNGSGSNFLGTYAVINNTGGNLPHNHGDSWRPLSAVGILCRKNP